MQEIITAISTVGFPCVMVLILLYMQRENNKQHKEETDSLVKALNNNNVLLAQLKELLEIKLNTEVKNPREGGN